MVTRPSRVLFSWAGRKGMAMGAPTKGLGRFFQRTKAVFGAEPMYSPHRVYPDRPTADWGNSVFGAYHTAFHCFLLFFFFAPLMNTISYYCERTYVPLRVPLPGLANVYSDLDDPDWRMKREMHMLEKAEGPRPAGYNRYLDIMKGIRVSDPDFKPYIPSEHGESVGPHASEIIRRNRFLADRAAAN